MKLIHIDSSILGDNSASRGLSARIAARFAGADVTYHDVAATPLPHLDLGALPGDSSDAAKASAALLDEFLAADTIVIGAPMYNFTIPTQLKGWIDRVLVAGKTFAYTEAGPVGLAGGKRVIIAVTRGGLYSEGAPAASVEHQQSYLAAAFGFIGITPEFIIAEGLALGAEHRAGAIAAAEAAIDGLAV